jgi:hypothetical protein
LVLVHFVVVELAQIVVGLVENNFSFLDEVLHIFVTLVLAILDVVLCALDVVECEVLPLDVVQSYGLVFQYGWQGVQILYCVAHTFWLGVPHNVDALQMFVDE